MNKEQALFSVIAGSFTLGVIAGYSVTIRRFGRWHNKQMEFAQCHANALTVLLEAALDDETSVDEFVKMVEKEFAFLEIIQPNK